MKKITRRNHTVPAGYLKGFVENINEKKPRSSIISIYDRKENQYRKQTLNDTTVITDFYTVEDLEGKPSDIIEVMLGDEVDGKVGQIINKINLCKPLCKEDLENLLLFIAFQKERVEENILSNEKCEADFTKSMLISKSLKEGLSGLQKHFQKNKIEMTPEKLREHYDYIIDGNYDIKVGNNNHSMTRMLQRVEICYTFLEKMSYVILKAPKGRAFITSDSPFCMTAPPENGLIYGAVGFGTKDLEIHFPISKTRCLLMTNKDVGWREEYIDIPLSIVRNINKRTGLNSYRFLLGNSSKLLQSITKQVDISGMGDFKNNISAPYI